MTHDAVFYLVLAVAVTILGLSKGGFAGIGMVSTPLVAAFSDPLTAAGLMLPVMMVQDPVAVFLYRRSFDRSLLRRMLPGAVLGVALAYVFAASVPEWSVQAVLGVLSLGFALWQLAILRRGVPDLPPVPRFDRVLGLLSGAGSGFSSAIAHAGSPPFQIYVMPRHLPKEVYVGTSVMFFAATNVMKVPSFAALGLFRSDLLALSVLYMPLAVFSSWLGVRLVRYVDVQRFNVIITLILLLIGLSLLWQSAADLSAWWHR
ncbi:MAG: sulfite exporter TauE/SafE family protein [Rhodobacter sp.]|nr:sulfite exporter TauE/SafE family protein [Paracoccaceae bacterium]MCB1409275.1 sulfite exporter TauE/SafE family protein [Paracoccaceae bacterium]MCC0081435.1 sulfite exporter TauE/SafE family protein [Rhodobacter sp.]